MSHTPRKPGLPLVQILGLGCALVGAALAMGVVGSGCSSCAGRGGGSRDDLALLPKNAQIVFGANLGRARDTAVWRKLLDLRDQTVADAKKGAEERARLEQAARGDGGASADSDGPPRDYPEFVKRCGFDPFTQLDGVFLGLPSPPVDNEFGLILHGTFDEAKLLACGRGAAKQEHSELVETEYVGKKMYNDAGSGSMFVSFLDGKTVVLGGREWSKRILELATGKGDAGAGSARDNAALAALIGKARTGDAIWGAGVIGDEIRGKLKANDKLASAGSLKDLYGSLDFQSGLSLLLNFELGSDADAQDLAKKIGEQVGEAKKSPTVLIAGLSSYFDAITVEAKGSSLQISVKLTPQQVDDLLGRAMGLLQRVRGLGGRPGGGPGPGMMPGMPGMPPGGGPGLMPPMPGGMPQMPQ